MIEIKDNSIKFDTKATKKAIKREYCIKTLLSKTTLRATLSVAEFTASADEFKFTNIAAKLAANGEGFSTLNSVNRKVRRAVANELGLAHSLVKRCIIDGRTTICVVDAIDKEAAEDLADLDW